MYRILGRVSVFALAAASVVGFVNAAQAQTATSSEDIQEVPETITTDQIVVTGTRLRGGFQAPTPTTVIGVEQLEMRATTNIASLLNETPAFKGSFTGTTAGVNSANAGSNFLNLRGLGSQRTLVLVNGRRHVPTTSAGLVDLNAIPADLIGRVEVVTGGASAAYGSDAVAGVVNVILDDKLTGFKFGAQYGQTEHGDNKEFRLSGAFGASFADDRGHVIFGAEYVDNKGILNQDRRDWGSRDYQLIANPAYTATNGQFQRFIAENVHPVNATEGGLITTGPGAGLQFTPGSGLAPFTFGTARGASYMIGGDGVNISKYLSLLVPSERTIFFGRASFDLSDALSIFAEASYARSQSANDLIPSFDFGNITIRPDNAFLTPAISAATGNQSFRMGRINTDFGFFRGAWDNKTKRGVIGLDGKLGNNWKWNAYFQEGETDYYATLRNRVVSRFNNAVDSVLVGGRPTCRINTDASPANDDPNCAPVNLFGAGSPSQAAIDYIMQLQWQRTIVNQRVAEVSIDGSPFATWAGDVQVAFGGDYRRESVDTTVDPLALASAFSIGNPKPIKGSYSVKELFGEIQLPLLADTGFAQHLDLNGAVRYTDYSTTGGVVTWKVGATWDINDSIRFRISRSRDIRAPNIDELFSTSQLRFGTVFDPFKNNAQVNITTLTGGNLALKPEKADTFTAGIVLQPTSIPGLRVSVDYYDIKVNGSIGTLTGQEVVTRCFGGATDLCGRLVRDGSGTLTQIVLTQLNLSRLNTRGVDAELSYTRPLGGGSAGTMTFRTLASYVAKLETFDGVTSVDRAGAVANGIGGVPHWRLNSSVTYARGAFTGFLQGRFVGGGVYDTTFGPLAVDKLGVNGRYYLDATLKYDITKSVQITANVSNLMDQDPPAVPNASFFGVATAPDIYDVIGRTFTIGARVRF